MNLKSRSEAEGEFTQNMASGRHHRRGGQERHSDGVGDLCRDVIPLKFHKTMDRGMRMSLL